MSSKPTSKPGPKGVPVPKAKGVSEAAPDVAQAEGAVDRAGALKLRDLVERVASATGGKKKAVKDIVEATLTTLGAALAKGEELNLPGVGKVRVVKSADRDGRALMTLKVRGTGSPKPKAVKEALAEAGEAV